MPIVRTRLNQAAILLLGFPIFVIALNALRIMNGGRIEPLIFVGLAYCLVAVAVALGLVKRKRGAWTSAVILAALCTPISMYAGWTMLRTLLGGKSHPGAALYVLVAFHVIFLLSSVVPLAILLSARARRELHGI
jgi:hypothetical protein